MRQGEAELHKPGVSHFAYLAAMFWTAQAMVGVVGKEQDHGSLHTDSITLFSSQTVVYLVEALLVKGLL